jgi:branched-chain amino acid transport system ATP-binding protein
VLKERRNQYASTMSGGQQQMLAIARALMTSPDMLIIDEPSVGLAPIVSAR